MPARAALSSTRGAIAASAAKRSNATSSPYASTPKRSTRAARYDGSDRAASVESKGVEPSIMMTTG